MRYRPRHRLGTPTPAEDAAWADVERGVDADLDVETRRRLGAFLLDAYFHEARRDDDEGDP